MDFNVSISGMLIIPNWLKQFYRSESQNSCWALDDKFNRLSCHSLILLFFFCPKLNSSHLNIQCVNNFIFPREKKIYFRNSSFAINGIEWRMVTDNNDWGWKEFLFKPICVQYIRKSISRASAFLLSNNAKKSVSPVSFHVQQFQLKTF